MSGQHKEIYYKFHCTFLEKAFYSPPQAMHSISKKNLKLDIITTQNTRETKTKISIKEANYLIEEAQCTWWHARELNIWLPDIILISNEMLNFVNETAVVWSAITPYEQI